MLIIVIPWYPWRIGSKIPPTPIDTKTYGCPLYKMAEYLHIPNAYPPECFKSLLDDLKYLIQLFTV